MKNKILNRAAGTAAAFVLTAALALVGCEQYTYDGPSVEEIGAATAEAEVNEGLVATLASQFVSLGSYGTLTVVNPVKAWGQTDAEYTLTVDAAEYTFVPLSAEGVWTTASTAVTVGTSTDGKFGLSFPVKAAGPVEISFTLTNARTGDARTVSYPANAQTIKGTLKVTITYDATKALASQFAQSIGATDSSGEAAAGWAVDKAISAWGQADAAYTVTTTGNSKSITIPTSVRVGYTSTTYAVETKTPTTTSATITINPSSSNNTSYAYSFQVNNSNLADSSTVSIPFRVTNPGDATQTVSGTITVKFNYNATDLETAQLNNIKQSFEGKDLDGNYNQNSGLAYKSNVTGFWVDTPITAWTTAAYTITVPKNISGASNITLPSSGATWTVTGTSTATGTTVSGSNLSIGSTAGTVTLTGTFTYTSPISGSTEKTLTVTLTVNVK